MRSPVLREQGCTSRRSRNDSKTPILIHREAPVAGRGSLGTHASFRRLAVALSAWRRATHTTRPAAHRPAARRHRRPLARVLATKAREQMGTFIVDNSGGDGGVVARVAQRGRPDGYTSRRSLQGRYTHAFSNRRSTAREDYAPLSESCGTSSSDRQRRYRGVGCAISSRSEAKPLHDASAGNGRGSQWGAVRVDVGIRAGVHVPYRAPAEQRGVGKVQLRSSAVTACRWSKRSA